MEMENAQSHIDSFNKLAEEVVDESVDLACSVVKAISPITGINSIIQATTKVLSKWVLKKVCFELKQRNPTNGQMKKIGIFAETAIKTFYDLYDKSCKDGEEPEFDHSESDAWRSQAYEIAENLFIKASNESQEKKLIIEGCFLGREMYMNTSSFEEIFHLTNFINRLTYRQVIMIKLLKEYIPRRGGEKQAIPDWLHLKKTTSLMEFQQLLTLGLFEVGEDSVGWASLNLSGFNYDSDIFSTDFAHECYEKFMLQEIPQNEVDEIVLTF